MKRAVLILAALAVTACGGTISSGPPSPPPTIPATARPVAAFPPTTCGVERWQVKTGTDTGSTKVSLANPVPITVDQVAQMTFPPQSALQPDARMAPYETTDYVLTGILVKYKEEGDSDVHMVIQSLTSAVTIIAEIPDPYCVGASSPWLGQITTARTNFDAIFHPAATWTIAPPGIQVTVSGPGFWDFDHGQTGRLCNSGTCAEIHPVLTFQAKSLS